MACAAEGTPRNCYPRLTSLSLANEALKDALEAVRQDTLTHELLESMCARLEDLPPLAAADPLQGLPCAQPNAPSTCMLPTRWQDMPACCCQLQHALLQSHCSSCRTGSMHPLGPPCLHAYVRKELVVHC